MITEPFQFQFFPWKESIMFRRYLAVASLTPILATMITMIVAVAFGQEPRPAPQSNNLGFLSLYRPSPDQLLAGARTK
jgi:hypothetical protein